MGYNDVIVCVGVINLTNAFFFIGLDQSRLTYLDRSDFCLRNATNQTFNQEEDST